MFYTDADTHVNDKGVHEYVWKLPQTTLISMLYGSVGVVERNTSVTDSIKWLIDHEATTFSCIIKIIFVINYDNCNCLTLLLQYKPKLILDLQRRFKLALMKYLVSSTGLMIHVRSAQMPEERHIPSFAPPMSLTTAVTLRPSDSSTEMTLFSFWLVIGESIS